MQTVSQPDGRGAPGAAAVAGRAARRMLAVAVLAVPLAAPPRALAQDPAPDQAGVRPTHRTALVRVVDDSVKSAALSGRWMKYRVLLPATYDAGARRYASLYLLHGYGGAFSNWETHTRLADHLAPYDLVIVLPEGENSYYVNATAFPAERFETYIQDDLVKDVEGKYRVMPARYARAIGGLSMGGYGALKFGLRRPAQFAVAGSMSGAVGAGRSVAATAAPSEPASPAQVAARERTNALLGPPGSPERARNDLFALVDSSDAGKLPYLYLDCGTEDGLLDVNREFAALLLRRKAAYEYHELPGGHTWDYWDRRVVAFLDVLSRRIPMGGPPH
ncbi:MAG: alpha/beta hydrolase-fold protein [Gemmatimonadaceae bacterium]